ncbi:conserved hypothetical protein [Gluconacetobacter diazotrophicus PA1 5]|uniref:Uncharacterized protein n=1 Tax=Gluconacetobacter diazotrophicus (strain ATCC 49037 / DSM 5601 / CCUG 37298 / CIP 103539 / LMG 7603 / PAl5) TaxID=272568 RepID=A9HB89_GLUDA|nr:hypothetical protein [Gluconacetobacter diazotrophicus]ACI50961.1 conserved hypothetical protein [Gluconacetobacter diazotrophicus PA1 5]TWB08584.1 hypothetical protein FBZ86_10681 [Gluconacetobacter diazotrophicus]CAP54782.1 hypothetical protein GDI0839 [Gluconacetobacter diazotrophicus PA1 5]
MPRFIEDDDAPANTGPDKHEQARRLAEAALRAEEEGQQAHADELFAEAERTDPLAVENVLMEWPEHPRARRHGRGPT